MSEKMNFFCILSQIGEENRRFGALPPILITFGLDSPNLCFRFFSRFSAAEKPEFNIVDTLFSLCVSSVFFPISEGENTVFDFRG